MQNELKVVIVIGNRNHYQLVSMQNELKVPTLPSKDIDFFSSYQCRMNGKHILYIGGIMVEAPVSMQNELKELAITAEVIISAGVYQCRMNGKPSFGGGAKALNACINAEGIESSRDLL